MNQKNRHAHTNARFTVRERVSKRLSLTSFLYIKVHISRLFLTYNLESLSFLAQITHNLQIFEITLMKKELKKCEALINLPCLCRRQLQYVKVLSNSLYWNRVTYCNDNQNKKKVLRKVIVKHRIMGKQSGREKLLRTSLKLDSWVFSSAKPE